jgi:hypothetical protein
MLSKTAGKTKQYAANTFFLLNKHEAVLLISASVYINFAAYAALFSGAFI